MDHVKKFGQIIRTITISSSPAPPEDCIITSFTDQFMGVEQGRHFSRESTRFTPVSQISKARRVPVRARAAQSRAPKYNFQLH